MTCDVRVSLNLPSGLVDRLNAQAELTGISRQRLIHTAVEGLVLQFEAIDAEYGRPCTCGSPRAHARWCPYSPPQSGAPTL